MKQNGRKIFWGVMFILGAMALLVGRLGYFEDISLFSIVFSIVLIGSALDGLLHRNFWVMLFSVAFFIIINDGVLGLEAITPWPVLGAALLGSIGLGCLFPEKWQKHHHGEWKKVDEEQVVDSVDGEQVYVTCSFGEHVKYITSQNLAQAFVKNTFGSLTVYLDNAALKDQKARLQVENSFGEVQLFIPSDWAVTLNVKNSFGATEEKGHCNHMSEKQLLVEGSVAFGDLEIIYM